MNEVGQDIGIGLSKRPIDRLDMKAYIVITLTLSSLIGIKTCFLKGFFVVMLTFGLTEPDLLIILISTIFLGNTVRNTSLI